MNTKKSKSKSRSKPVIDEETRNIVSELPLTNIENVVKEDSTLEVTDLAENNSADDVPKKPKRTKGKKKKDILAEGSKIFEEGKASKHQEMDVHNIDDSEELIKDVPIVSKKKNKSKNSDIQAKSKEADSSTLVEVPNIKEVPKAVSCDPSLKLSSIVTESTNKETLPQKKKKKKKTRHDSDKSETIDQQSCTLAFQKLLQSSSQFDENISDSEKLLETNERVKSTDTASNIAILIEENKEQPSEDVINVDVPPKEEVLKTKKKNKKGKKQLPIDGPDIKIENKESQSTEQPQVNIDLQDVTNVKEESPKPKAKIAKPVEKRKVKNDIQNTDYKNEHLTQTTECITFVADKIKEKTLNQENKDQANIDIKIKSDNEVKDQKTLAVAKISLDEEIQSSDIPQAEVQFMSDEIKSDFSDFETVTGKSAKNKKKKNKNVQNTSITETEKSVNIQDNSESVDLFPEITNITNNDLEVVPDFIDYPRSLSQLVVDNNNNTIIQEITTPEEVKLGIPIYSPTPVIQGSGESPEVRIEKENIDVKVTEIDFKIDKSSNGNLPTEKTDIKSKIIEVNRDMEELRRSIERSLAELTNVEKSDNDIEKEFEEIFQNQCQETNPVGNTVANHEPKTEAVSVSFKPENSQCCPFEAKQEASPSLETKVDSQKFAVNVQSAAPVCPARKDKGKGKLKKKGIQEHTSMSTSQIESKTSAQSASGSSSLAEIALKSSETKSDQKSKKEEKSNKKADNSEGKGKGKKRTAEVNDDNDGDLQEKKRPLTIDLNFKPIEKFEDALTSSVDDVNKTFDLIANDASFGVGTVYQNNPEINIIAPTEDTEHEEKNKQKEKKKQKQTPLSQPKNLLGHANIPVQSNKTEYKKGKYKMPDCVQAKVKIKDSVDIEKKPNEKAKSENKNEKLSDITQNVGLFAANTNEDLVYKYSFRKVFLQSICHVCQKQLNQRISCQFCSLVFYCSTKHKDENWPQHQPLCFAVSTIAHLKDQKHIYADIKNVTGQEYRILRMQIILSCEKILKRKLLAWEQEMLLYPRICADVGCREWRQRKLTDCVNCGQVSYCSDRPEHLPPTHQRWCKSYSLYQKLVIHHQNFGNLDPKLPTKVLEHYEIPDNINEVLGSLYEEKIDISDIEYAALTQKATVPLTAMFCYQLFTKRHSSLTNGLTKKSSFTIHSICSDVQSDADSLKKWETFFLHLLSEIKELRVVLFDPNLKDSKLPLELLGKIKLCESCVSNKRRVLFDFEDKKNYEEYYSNNEFVVPNIVCAFNPSIQRSSAYSKDAWSSAIYCILKQKIPFIITSSSMEELRQDLECIKAISNYNIISDPKYNPFASVRPDRNFITDHETPLLFKNHFYSVLCGA